MRRCCFPSGDMKGPHLLVLRSKWFCSDSLICVLHFDSKVANDNNEYLFSFGPFNASETCSPVYFFFCSFLEAGELEDAKYYSYCKGRQ